MRTQIDGLDDQRRLRGLPLGVLQVFTPIRMGDVPDCRQSHGSLGCAPRESPAVEGSSKVRGIVRPETVSTFRQPLVPGGSPREVFIPSGVLSNSTRGPRCGRPDAVAAETRRAR
jgi:hypothetical protein